MDTVILPRLNERALLEDVPAEVRRRLTIHLVSTVGEVIALALPGAGARTSGGRDREPILIGKSAA
jgi:ATP-dependent Lon protease